MRWLSAVRDTNRNVSLTFLYRFSNATARGIWSHSSMATYVYLLEHNSAKWVGLAQGIQGTLALVSIPAGWLADRLRRDQVLRWCAISDCGAIACTAVALLLPQNLLVNIWGTVLHAKFLWLCVALALWGLGQGAGPVSEALLADSTHQGSRAKLYSAIYSISLAGTSIGPCAAAAAFAVTGNKWNVETLQHVILTGLVVAVIPVVSLFFFDDDRALGDESEAEKAQQQLPYAASSGEDQQDPPHKLTSSSTLSRLKLSAASVPWLLATSDLGFGLASGMTIKFFPIFFLREVGLAPVATNFVMAGSPLAVAAVSAVTAPFARTIGRVQCILLFKFVGVALLGLIGLFPSLWTSVGIVVPAYIIRTAVMNSAFPLQKSILMDYVSKESRARWNSIDGVLIFGWSGSALLGGILVDSIGFGSTFCITALMQGIGVCILIPLAFLVPRREDRNLMTRNGARATVTAAAEAGTSLEIADTDVEMPIEAPVALSAEAVDLQRPLLQTQRSNQGTDRGPLRD